MLGVSKWRHDIQLNDTKHNDTQHEDLHHNDDENIIVLSVVKVNVVAPLAHTKDNSIKLSC